MLGAVQSGVPNPYPVVVNAPLDRAYLRPLQEPLYDTESINFASVTSPYKFFTRPINQADASGLITSKQESETNINQASMLDYPKEFSILGFNVVLDYTIGLEAQSLIYRRCWFKFTFSGRRPYLQIPLDRIPQGQYLNGACAMGNISSSTTRTAHITQFANGMGHIANYYRFNLGRAALKIKPGEAFNTELAFPTALSGYTTWPTTLNNNFGKTADTIAGWRVSTYLIGLSWNPL
mgnify:CR=1 FL=1